MNTPMHSRRQQSGVALVTAILLVAMATALATKLAWDNQVSMRRTGATLTQEQARAMALGGEAAALDLISQDLIDFYDQKGLVENRTPRILPFEIGIDETVLGTMQGSLVDELARFNLNNLVRSDGTVDPPSRDIFAAIVDILKLDQAIVDAVIDWIDPDTVPTGTGVEDSGYMSLDPPYRTANNYFTSASELRAVAGIDDQVYAALRPHVTALLPGWCGSSRNVTPINVNTANAVVLEALHPDITESMATTMYEDASVASWDNWSIAGLPADFNQQRVQSGYATLETGCFGLNVLVNVGSSVLSMYSLLDSSASSGPIAVRSRTFGLE